MKRLGERGGGNFLLLKIIEMCIRDSIKTLFLYAHDLSKIGKSEDGYKVAYICRLYKLQNIRNRYT